MNAVKKPKLSAVTAAVRVSKIQTSELAQLDIALFRKPDRLVFDDGRSLTVDDFFRTSERTLRDPLSEIFTSVKYSPASTAKARTAYLNAFYEWLTASGYFNTTK